MEIQCKSSNQNWNLFRQSHSYKFISMNSFWRMAIRTRNQFISFSWRTVVIYLDSSIHRPGDFEGSFQLERFKILKSTSSWRGNPTQSTSSGFNEWLFECTICGSPWVPPVHWSCKRFSWRECKFADSIRNSNLGINRRVWWISLSEVLRRHTSLSSWTFQIRRFKLDSSN